MKTTVLPETGLVAATALHRLDRHGCEQPVPFLPVVLLGEEVGERLGGGIAEAVDVAEFGSTLGLGIRRRECGDRNSLRCAEMARQAARVGLADPADAECVEEAVQRAIVRRAAMAAKRLRTETSPKPSRLASRFRPALSCSSRAKMSDGRADHPLGMEQGDLLLAEPLDVEGVARHEMAQAFDPPGRGRRGPPVQRRTTSVSPVFSSTSRNAAEPQAGQVSGKT